MIVYKRKTSFLVLPAVLLALCFVPAGCMVGEYGVVTDNKDYYTVFYNANGGTGSMNSSVFEYGRSHSLKPNTFTMGGYTFAGWARSQDVEVEFTDRQQVADMPLDGSRRVDLYAKWGIPVPETTLAQKLAWLQANAESGGVYVCDVTADESLIPYTLSYSGRSDISVTIRGSGGQRVSLSLSSAGAMFTIGDGVTLVLDRDITLKGKSDNRNALVVVDTSSSKLVMNAGAKITGNTNPISNIASYILGGGVRIEEGGTFTMNGGEISNNQAFYGGGVFVTTGSYFNMYGGTVSRNTAKVGNEVYAYTSSPSPSYFNMHGGTVSSVNLSFSCFNMYGGTVSGGGVYVGESSSFNMYDGTVTGSTVTGVFGGGGVYINGSSFNMYGGTISGNTGEYGGGVQVYAHSYFNMYGGTVSGNTATDGGGVYVGESSYFNMHGGTVSGNTAKGNGGGVCVYGPTYLSSYFNMYSGTVSGNRATGDGGGVYVHGVDYFRISNGVVYGSDVAGNLANTAGTNATLALYDNGDYHGVAQHGIFDSNGDFTSRGDIPSTSKTIRVKN